METLEELILKQLIQKQENEVDVLNSKIEHIKQDTEEKKRRLWDLTKQRIPGVSECESCRQTYGSYRCSGGCGGYYCEDCIGFCDDEDMTYTCHDCSNSWW